MSGAYWREIGWNQCYTWMYIIEIH
jgi:hypothetical protein